MPVDNTVMKNVDCQNSPQQYLTQYIRYSSMFFPCKEVCMGEVNRENMGYVEISEIKVAKSWHLWLCFDIIQKVYGMKTNGFIVFKQVMQALNN